MGGATSQTRWIIHLDLDAFFASVEQQRRPELRGQPLIVGGAAGRDGRAELNRGVVSAASYEARSFGVRSAMPLRTALRLCPGATVVPVDFAAYRARSAEIFEIAQSVTPLVEPLSLDEAYLDVTGSEALLGDASTIARGLRKRILVETGLHASFGIATTKVVAKVASDLEKPQGFVVVAAGSERGFLSPLPLRALPGLGPAAESALSALGVATLGQLTTLPLETVQRRCGRAVGTALWRRAQGIDASEVSGDRQTKSVGREETFAHDVTDRGPAIARVRELSRDVAQRLRAGGWVGRTVSLKVRRGDFTTIDRQVTLATPTNSDGGITRVALDLLEAAWAGEPIRLVGVGVSGLDASSQLDLLDSGTRDEGNLDRTLDDLRRRFGDAAVTRGANSTLRDLDFRGEDLRRLGRRSGGGDETARRPRS